MSMETALKGLEKAIVTGRLKDRNKMERRLGKIQARRPQVNDLYDLALRDAPAGVRLFWEMKEDRKNWRQSREGAYLLRTNLQAESAEQLWSKYMQLTEAESSFRALKSDSRFGLCFISWSHASRRMSWWHSWATLCGSHSNIC